MNYRTDLQSLKRWLFLLLLAGTAAFSPAYGQGWKHIFFGGNKDDDAKSIIQTADEGYVVAGFSQSSGGDQDVFVTRVDVDGRKIWSYYYDKAFNEYGYDVIEAENGNLLVAGGVVLTQLSNEDMYLMKIAPDGRFLWAKNYGTAGDDAARAIIGTSDGNYLLVGRTKKPGSTEYDPFVIKVDTAGNEVWRKTYGSTFYSEEIVAVTKTADGYALAGYTLDSLTMQQRDFFVLHINEAGEERWSKRYEIAGFEEATDITTAVDGGLLVAGHKDQRFFFLIKVDDDGKLLWSKTYGGNNFDSFCYSLLQQPDGSIYLLGTTLPPTFFNGVTYLIKTDSNGEVIWEKSFGEGERYEQGNKLIPTLDGGFAIAGTKEISPATAILDIFIIKTDSLGNIYSNSVQGVVYYDVNRNCAYDIGIDIPLKNWLVRVEGENNSFYGSTNENGEYSILADTGRYNISVLVQNSYWDPCWDDQNRTFTQLYDTISTVDFPLQARIECPLLEVNVAAPGASACSNVTYTINYTNSGTVSAENTYIEVTLDDLLTFNSATLPVASQVGNTYRFDIGTVVNEEGGSFQISTAVACTGYISGQSYQVTAHIYPDSLCITPSPDWDMSSIKVEGECNDDEDQVNFTIRNVGSNRMQQAKKFYIVIDDVVFLKKDFQLEEGESLDTAFEATGATYRLIAEQSTGHPGMSYPTVAVEGCAEDGNANISVGYVTLFPEDDRDAFIAIDVQELQEGRPDNAMRGYPKGYGEEHYVEANTDLTYHIQFINTGTDTITQLVVRDTLSPYLDITTVKPGASSHPYTFETYGKGILRFTFKDLKLLPGESNGFVQFTVSQKPDLPKETVIQNTAVLFYNYNKPLLTNKVFHTVGGELEEFVVVTGTKDVFVEGVEISVEPNPFTESAFFTIKSLIPFKQYTLSLYDLQGRLLRQEQHTTNRFPIARATLAPGLYVYQLKGDGQLLNSGKIVVH